MAKRTPEPRFVLLWGKSKRTVVTPVVWAPSERRARTVAAHFEWTGWFAVADLKTGLFSEPFRGY